MTKQINLQSQKQLSSTFMVVDCQVLNLLVISACGDPILPAYNH